MHIEWKSCFRVGISAFLLFLAIYYWGRVSNMGVMLVQAAFPMVLGCIVAYVVNILMSFYERKIPIHHAKWQKIKRPTCMILSFLSVVVGIYCVIAMVIPQLIECFQVLLGAVPQSLDAFFRWANENPQIRELFSTSNLILPATQAEWNELLQKGANLLINGVGGAMNVLISTATSVVGGAISCFMSLIFATYILSSKEKLGSQCTRLLNRLLGEKRSAKVFDILHVADDCFHSYIVGQCIEAVILGGLCALGMFIFRMPYALMTGTVVGVTALIPIAGAYIGGAVGAIMIFSVSPMSAIGFIVFLIVLQQIEGNLIYPRTVGSTLALPALWVLTAVTLGGGVMGIVGMILFVPLTAVIYRLLGRYVNQPAKELAQQ